MAADPAKETGTLNSGRIGIPTQVCQTPATEATQTYREPRGKVAGKSSQ